MSSIATNERSRNLRWDTCPNIRDLGGLPTALSETGTTRYGRLARGPRREWISDLGWSQARSWGLHSVVDLRCAHEIGPRADDPAVSADATAGLLVIAAPTEDQQNEDFRRVCFPILDSAEYWTHNWRILPELVRASVESIANATPGTLIHCSAGRDRTGMVTALLLGNAHVDPDAVAADYAESVRIMASTAHHGPGADRQRDWSLAEVEAWLSDQLPIVGETAQKAPRILAQLGVHETFRARLRSLLVDLDDPSVDVTPARRTPGRSRRQQPISTA